MSPEPRVDGRIVTSAFGSHYIKSLLIATWYYWLPEVDAIKHRAWVGMRELEVYDVINKHFDRKFESILLDLTNGVFADCLLYETRQAEEADAGADTGEDPVLNELCDKYPDFARHFLASLKIVSAKLALFSSKNAKHHI